MITKIPTIIRNVSEQTDESKQEFDNIRALSDEAAKLAAKYMFDVFDNPYKVVLSFVYWKEQVEALPDGKVLRVEFSIADDPHKTP